jgi:hypothetical protein
VRRREERHLERMNVAWTAREHHRKPGKKRRGMPAQRGVRNAERRMKKSAVVCLRWARRHGLKREEIASRLRMAHSTLTKWERGWREKRLSLKARGRPPLRVHGEVRRQIIEDLRGSGASMGLPTLRGRYPDVARGELQDLQWRYRRLYRKQNRLLMCALSWELPGAVWAGDWSKPPLPVDGIYPQIQAVRDLGSENELMALPAETKCAQEAADALESLFKEHGPPLVVKTDNEFDAAPINDVLRTYEVLSLLNPPGMPGYNGAREAGIGALKTRAHHQAARNNRPGEWTCDDVEAARLQANQTHRPRGHRGPTPQELWEQRPQVTAHQRQELRRAVARLETTARLALKLPLRGTLDRWQRAAVNRFAISRALVELGFLKVRRMRITPRISKRKRARIS